MTRVSARSRQRLLAPTPTVLRVAVDALKPFAADVARLATFNDLQAVFGTDKYMTQKAVRILGFAQLLERRPSSHSATPAYALMPATIAMFTPVRATGQDPDPLDALRAAMQTAAMHNTASRFCRVVAVTVKGTVFDPRVDARDVSVTIEVTVAVEADAALAVELHVLLRSLDQLRGMGLNVSLVLELTLTYSRGGQVAGP